MGNDTGWPMVERRAQSQRIMDAFRRGAPSGFVIDGPAGIGKTRLAVETTSQLARHGVPTVWTAATGHPGEHVELAARVSAGRMVLGIDDAESLAAASATLLAH